MAVNMLLVSGAVRVGTSKTGRKIIATVVAILAVILFLLIAFMANLLSIFLDLGHINLDDFDAKKTGIYQDIRALYDDFVDEQKEEIKDLSQQYHDDNMASKTELVYNPVTKKDEEKKSEYCKAEITTDYSYLQTAYVMAYLSIKNNKSYINDKSKISADKEELFDFWGKVSPIVVEANEEDANAPTYHIYNKLLTLDDIATTFFNEEKDCENYKQSVYLISQYIGNESFGESIGIDGEKMDIPLYYQYAAPWGGKKYGSGTIAKNGCGPTCIAMVFSYLRDENIYPDDVVDFTKDRYYIKGSGSSWSIFSACAGHWNIGCKYIGLNAGTIANELSAGHPVILSMGPGTFTKSGHFIVLTGINDDGTVTVNDPNDNANKDHINKHFDLTQILKEAKGGWSFG